MSERVQLDIMLPFWGKPSYLYEAVRSVREQTSDGWRLTVIDDAYPDDEVPRFFAALDDPRVRYIRHDTNVGIIQNFQAAADLAEADYTLLLGSDDRLHPDYVRDLALALRANPRIDVVAPSVVVIDENGDPHTPLADRVKKLLSPRRSRGAVVLSGEKMVASLSRGNWLYWPSLAIRTSRLRSIPFRTDLPIILDLAMLLDIAFDEGGLLYLNGPARFFYRRHRASLSQKAILDGVRFSDEARFHREVARRSRQRGWSNAAFWAAARPSSRLHALTALPEVLRAGDRRGARAALGNVLGP